MATYRIDFSTNASRVAQEIDKVNEALTEAVRTSKPVEIRLDDTNLSRQLNATFKSLDKEIAKYERQLRKLQIGTPAFGAKASQIGQVEGQRQRATMEAQAIRLRSQAGAFPQESFAGLSREIQAARISASMVQPNTEAWVNLQREIARLNLDLKKADQLAENIQLTEQLGAFSTGSLNALEAKLTILRNRAREISPNEGEWKNVNREIVKTEQAIERQTRRPLTTGQRMGAAGGAFLYGGGLGGGVGSAVGGIAGGLTGGVSGAFTGAAIGQAVDNMTAMAFAMNEQANAIKRLRLGLASASTNLEDFAQANQVVNDISNRLLIPLEETYRQFTRLKASTVALGIDTKTTGQIFEGISVSVLKTGGSMEDVAGAMRAVSQVFSKGKVTAEELRGQLGERLPGAVVKFAKANKIALQDLDKAFESGQVSVDQFVTFAKGLLNESAGYSDDLATRQEYASARYAKAVERMQLAIGKAVGPMLNSIQSFAAQAINEILGLTGKLNDFANFLEKKFGGGGAADSVFLGEGPRNIADRLIGGDVELKDIENRTKLFEAKIKESQNTLAKIQSGRYKDTRNIFERMFGGPGEESLRKGLPNQIKFYKQQLNELFEARRIASEKTSADSAMGGGGEDPEANKRASKFLDIIEQREENLANARKQREEELASIRENAIKQIEALERRYQDERLRGERDLAKTRRDLAASIQEQSLLGREAAFGLTGEDPVLIDQQRRIGEAIRNYTEEKISLEQQEQDRKIAQDRELEDFKKTNADGINKANERYAKAIGKIQQEYAKSVAKLVEDGSKNGANRLAAAGKLIAADIQRATQQQAFTAATGGAIIPRGGGKFEVAGDVYNEAELIQAAEAMSKAAGTAAKAYVEATKQVEKAQQELNASTKNTARATTVSTGTVNTADLDARFKAAQQSVEPLNQSIADAKNQLNEQQNILKTLKKEFADIGQEGQQTLFNLREQKDTIAGQLSIMRDGFLPVLAEENIQARLLFDVQEKRLKNAAEQLLTGTKDKETQEKIKTQLQEQLSVLGQSKELYFELQQAVRDYGAELEAAKINAQTQTIGKGLSAGFINEARSVYEEQISKGVSPEIAASVARATEQFTMAKTAADAFQDSINGIGTAFGEIMTTGVASLITGTATAKEVFTSFLQSVAQALSQAAAQMIATYIAIGIAKMFAGLGGAASSGGAGPAPGVNVSPTGNIAPLPIAGAVQAANGAYWSGGFQAFASGGMVAGPTLGLIGEGGEPEFVIPSSKMEGAMKRYNNGARGAGVIPSGRDSASPMDPGGMIAMGPIDVRYTVERINSVDYVTADQFQAGMSRAAQQGALQGEQRTLRKLRNSQTVRSRMGI